MGRNKYPEQTRERILETAVKLFVEKGYEQTSIQDILDALQLSKGGIYHHFKSKEEIFEAVMQKRAEYAAARFHEIIQNTQAENGKEKLKKIIFQLGADLETQTLDTILTAQVNPHFVVGGLRTCIKQDAPVVSKLIEEGVRDGSLQTAQPGLCAEVFLLLLNYWANPILFGYTAGQTEERLRYLQGMMRLLGLDVVDDSLIEAFLTYYKKEDSMNEVF